MRRWLLAGVVCAGLGAGVGYGALLMYRRPGPLPRPSDVVIPHGGLEGVTGALLKAGVIDHALAFRALAWLTAFRGPIHAAELAFPAHASIAQSLVILRNGRPVQHLLTIAEGLTSAQVATVLVNGPGLVGDIEVPAEGAVLPQTYAYEWGASRASVVSRAEAAMSRALAGAWRTRDPEIPVRSARQMLIVASLVERETHLAAERALVAGVFYNRLRLGMRLQSDPTVSYVQTGGTGVLVGGLTRAALEHASPYNTYVLPGLPVGPICDPGIASIEAAAHPADTKALYFVADGSGGHIFADTLAEHEKNVLRYRALAH